MNNLKISRCTAVCFLIFSTAVLSAANDIDFEGRLNIRLEHSLSNTHVADYTTRGNVTVQGGLPFAYNNPLTLQDKQKLQLLAREDKFYRLKAFVINNDCSETEFLTSIKACMLAQSGLNDFVSISLDHSSNVVGISIGVQQSVACQGSSVSVDRLVKFNTKVYVMPIAIGPIPDTASYIQKLEREREAKERGDIKDNRSFLAKYWMYIVPVVIIMVLSSAANPDGAAGGGRQQGS
ncbi:ER membrane protein complex subunit 10 [Carabus blaptoides fortunei]